MKKTILFALIAMLVAFSASSHEFFGCKIGDNIKVAKKTLKSGGYKVAEKGETLVLRGEMFAGIYFDLIQFSFDPELYNVTFLRFCDNPREKYEETNKRLTAKYGEGTRPDEDGKDSTTYWDMGDIVIVSVYVEASDGEQGVYTLMYGDGNKRTNPDDDL